MAKEKREREKKTKRIRTVFRLDRRPIYLLRFSSFTFLSTRRVRLASLCLFVINETPSTKNGLVVLITLARFDYC